MAEGKTLRQRHLDGDPSHPRSGFAVVFETVVGHVDFGDGELNPLQAALMIVGEHGDEGRYRFPGPHENSDCVVEITYVMKSVVNDGDELR